MTESGRLSFTLDVFPEVVEKNTAWKKHKAEKYSTEVTQEDINATLDQLRSSYAQFEDVDIVGTDSLMRLKVSYQNKK
jgi:FKBP-type peptidyl-prolyl cis-trans isomerase (trigger factor)